MTTLYTIPEMVEMAAEAKLEVAHFMRAVQVEEAHKTRKEAQRRATQDEKDAIGRAVSELASAGKLSKLTAADILAEAGVRKVQGTATFATKERTRVLEIADVNKDLRQAA